LRASLISLLLVITSWATAQDITPEKKGDFSGQWRNYFMGTYNKGDLKDFYSLATGGKIGYTYTFNEHFKIGGFAYTSFNLNLQDLTKPDPATGKISRYEAGLFDATDLTDRLVLFPGELYLEYTIQSHQFTAGRMKLISPFLNPEDGRMIPTLEQGLWYKFDPDKNWKIQAGIINAIAPRSTGGFYNIGESLGTYPVGRSIAGPPSGYFNNTASDFIALANVNWKNELVELDGWNYYVDNLFNTFYFKPKVNLGEGTQLAMEYLHQNQVGEGGNAIDSLQYFSHNTSDIIGGQVSQNWGKSKISIGYDYILPHGRFLFPREWGREFLFSFQKRERSEGSANNHALLLTVDRSFGWKESKLRSILSIGHHWKPSVTNAEDNKYGQPNYTHFNLDLFYTHKKFNQLKPELLLTYKVSSGDFPENPNFIINKVDMFQINLVVNYNF